MFAPLALLYAQSIFVVLALNVDIYNVSFVVVLIVGFILISVHFTFFIKN